MTEEERDKFIRDLAQRTYSSEGCVEIDEDAEISYGDDDGAYVKAWVWVGFCDTPLSKDCSECGEAREECTCEEEEAP